MTDEIIPEDAKQFILRHIDSIAQMECLLLLKANPQTEWNAKTIAKGLYISEQETVELLQQLSMQGLIAMPPGSQPNFVYKPESPDLEAMMDRVAELYVHHLVPVTHLIHSKPKNRIQEFADAFRIRKD